jgi:hypothetical protein
MSMRLAVLGGSAVATVQLVEALADWPGGEARRPAGLELVLHGRSERLEAVAAACRLGCRSPCEPSAACRTRWTGPAWC